MKIDIKLFYIYFLALIIFSPASWAAADENDIKYWLGDQKIVVEKGNWFDTKEPINSSNIVDLKTINQNIEHHPLGTSKATIMVKFGYNYEDKLIPCDATIAYSWIKRGENKLETIIINCTP